MAVAVSWVWIPLAAEVTVANTGDNTVAPALLREVPLEVRYVLGDTHYHTPELRAEAWQQGREIVATRPGPYPHRDGGAVVRSIFHKLRSLAIEPFNGLFKNIFEWGGYLPVKGLKRPVFILKNVSSPLFCHTFFLICPAFCCQTKGLQLQPTDT